ncbi:MAG: hypothetical protein ACRC33_08920, partial [Gemmataceae bacterium]
WLPVPGAAVALLATVGLASASWYLFEGPISGLKRWFPYDTRAPLREESCSAPATSADTVA